MTEKMFTGTLNKNQKQKQIILIGAESIGIVAELKFTVLQHILVIWSAVSSPYHTVSSSANALT